MSQTAAENINSQLLQLDAASEMYASRFVELVLDSAQSALVSDVHLQPVSDGLEVHWRRDGVLNCVGRFKRGESTDVVTRLKVLAQLLTYRTDIPQEGRIQDDDIRVEMRVSTFPTLYGERAVVRLFASREEFPFLTDLGLPADIEDSVSRLLLQTSGSVLITGPAGSGKTTTAYACLRELVRQTRGSRSIVTLEDPIEVAIEGVAQSQVNEAAEFDLQTGLRSLMRQDPEVILVGEIRDPTTAEIAFQASLTGHLVLTTFHAGTSATAISRLSDMGIEPYLLRSGILAILSQRLVRRLCDCKRPVDDQTGLLGLPVRKAFRSGGCSHCLETGYQGRSVVAELLMAQPTDLGRAILSRGDSAQLEQLACEAGMTTIFDQACQSVEHGITSPSEVRRVFGVSIEDTSQ